MKTFNQFRQECQYIIERIIRIPRKVTPNKGALGYTDSGRFRKIGDVTSYKVDPKELNPKVPLVRDRNIGNTRDGKPRVNFQSMKQERDSRVRSVIDKASQDAKSGKIESQKTKDRKGQAHSNVYGFGDKLDKEVEDMVLGPNELRPKDYIPQKGFKTRN